MKPSNGQVPVILFGLGLGILACISAFSYLSIQGLVEQANGDAYTQPQWPGSAAAIIVAGTVAGFAMLTGAFFLLRRQIARRAAAESAAVARATDMEGLYNKAACAFQSVDRTGTYVHINDTELAWLGYSRDEVVGKLKFVDVIAPECMQTVRDNFARMLAGTILENHELTLLRKDGSRIPVLVNAVPLMDAEGNFVMSGTTMFDISDLKRVERQYREANAFLDAVIDNIPSMLFIKDAQTLRFTRINKAEEQLLGIPRGDLVGKSDYDFFPKEQADFFTAKDREVLASSDVLNIAEEELTSGGITRILRTRKIGLNGPDGKPQYLIGISDDITEQKQTERAIRALNANLEIRANQLEAANKELESFSYSVSHDLRAPLRAIDGFSRIFEEDYAGMVDEEGRRLLKVVRDNSRKMGLLIDDLLAFSRLGRQLLATEPVSMKALAEEALAEARADAPERSTVAIADLPTVQADPILLRQVWINLLSNAFKYSSTRQSPVIEVGFLPAAGTNDHVTFFVKDNGVGFDMRYADKLFGVFQRLHSVEEFSGTGVGLAIVHRLVTRHGGRVWAEAELDKGATFFFSLPSKERNDRI